MNFFQQELRKIIGYRYPNASYNFRACYIPLSDELYAKIFFTSCGVANRYESLRVTILNSREGKIDTNQFRFSEVLGRGQTCNPYIQRIGPFVWSENGRADWYAYHPGGLDYRKLGDAITNYLKLFMQYPDPEMP